MTTWLLRVRALLRSRRDSDPVFVDTHDLAVGGRLREIEFRQQLDQESCVLRTSGKVAKPVRRLTAPVVRQKGLR